MLYASHFPERIEGMFLMSPVCEDSTREGWVYDPYSIRVSNTEDVNVPRSEVDNGIQMYANNTHPFDETKNIPNFLIRMGLKSEYRKDFKEEYFTDEMAEAAASYVTLMAERRGRQDVVLMSTFIWSEFLKIPIHTPEMML